MRLSRFLTLGLVTLGLLMTGPASVYGGEVAATSITYPAEGAYSTEKPGPNGTSVLEISTMPLGYSDETGATSSLDLDIVPASDKPGFTHAVKKNLFRAYLNESADQPTRFVRGQHGVTFRPVNSRKTKAKFHGNKATYDDLWPGVKAVYSVLPGMLKEELTLSNRSVGNVFSFEIDTEGVTWRAEEDGGITFLNSQGESPFQIPPPFAYDSRDGLQEAGKVTAVLRTEGTKTYLDLVVDPEWLRDPNRVFPVIVDPTISVHSGGTENAYFEINFPQTFTYSYNVWGHSSLFSSSTGYFAIYNPAGTREVYKSKNGNGEIADTNVPFTVGMDKLGKWKVSAWAGSWAGSGGSVTYAYVAAPTAVPISPVSGTKTNTATPEIRWSFSDPDGHALVESIVQFSQSTTFASVQEVSVAGASSTIPTAPLAEGTWYWRVRSKCSGGGWSLWGSTQTIVVDTVPPTPSGTPSVTESADGNGNLVVRWGAASDDTTGVSSYALYVGTAYGVPDILTVPNITSTSYTLPALPYNLRMYAWVQASDGVGLQGPLSSPKDLQMLSARLSGTGTAKQTAYFTISYPQTFTYSADLYGHDSLLTHDSEYFDIFDPSGNKVQRCYKGNNGSYLWNGQITATPTQLGRWRIELFGTNQYCGGWGRIDYSRDIAPTVLEVQPLDGGGVDPDTAEVTWTPSEPLAGQVSTMDLEIAPTADFSSGIVAVSTVEGEPIALPGSNLGDGKWFWRVRAKNQWASMVPQIAAVRAWGTSPWSTPRIVSVDRIAPLPPTDIRVATTESAGSYIHIISWTPGSDDNSGVLGYRITAETERGAKDLANAQLVTGTEFTISTALSSSLYVTICTVDRAGNPSADIGWPDLGRVINYSWEYDELGNRTVQTKNSVTTSYNWYSDTNELKQILQGLAVVNLEYDANGNNTKRTTVEPSKADEVWDYVYDTENRLVSVSQDGTLLAAYDYDAFGRRIRSVVAEPGKPAVLTVFIYVGGKVLYEERYQVPSSIVDPASALDLDLTFLIPLGSTDYVQGPAGLVAKAVTTAGGIGEVLTYYHQDHLGSTRVQTDADGGLLARFDYQPFGELLEAVYADPMTQSMEPFAYTGQRAEENIGLYYYGARFYDPAIGRFITQDPAQDGLNWYAYCNNNPILYTDPTGTKMAVGSSKDDEDDTTEGQHVWTGNETYDVDHAAVDTAIDKGTDEAYQEYFQYQDAVYSSNNLWWKPREITRVFEAWLAKNADELDVGDFWAWLGRVKTGGVWDIKRWKGVAGVSNFKFRGMNVEYDDLGNINYGYTGNDIGLSLNTLIPGSEAVALKHGGVDDPKDHFWIHAGYWMYP